MKRLFFVLIAVFACSVSFGQRYFNKTESDARYVQPTSMDTLTNKTLASPKINDNVSITATGLEINRAAIGAKSNIQSQADSIKLALTTKINITDTVQGDWALKSYVDSSIVAPYTGRIVEQKVRVADIDSISGGATLMVGAGQTYATFTAAYAAAASGDTIRAIAGTYDMAAEAGGYWLINTAAKGVIVCGVKNDPTAVILTQSTATYGIRLRDVHKMQFKDLTFSENQNVSSGMVTMESGFHTNYLKVSNCIFTNTNTGTSARLFYRLSLTGNTDNVFIEFKNCTFNHAGLGNSPIGYSTSGVNETMLIQNCTFNTAAISGIQYDSSNKGKLAVYDCIINKTVTGGYGILLGEDIVAPTNTSFACDLRNNTVNYTGTDVGHSILCGSGTNLVYCINNNLNIPATSSSGNLGLVIKTVSSSLGNSYFAGNRVTCGRPLYIKGGKNLTIKYNTFIANIAGYGALGVVNPAADLLSSTNVIEFNNFIGKDESMQLYASTSWEQPTATMQGWTMDYNRYYSTTGTWIADESSTTYLLSAKNNFWKRNYNDSYSIFITTPIIIYDSKVIFDNNTTVNQ